MEMYLTAYR